MPGFADDRGGRLRKKRHVCEARAACGLLQPAESFSVGGLAILRIGAREDYGVAEHNGRPVVSRHGVGLLFQALQHDADQSPDAEIGRPAVGADECELRQLVLHA